jgi:predicted nuclease of predicted toxin-antitoxin system
LCQLAADVEQGCGDRVVYFLIDECIPKSLARLLIERGHAVSRVIEVQALGRQAADRDIFRFAAESGAVIVTSNKGDFQKLFNAQEPRASVLIVPSLRPSDLNHLVELFLEEGHVPSDTGDGCWFIEAAPASSGG